MAVESVALKLPTFWVSSPLAWFAQAEAQFALRNISQDDTKYYHVVAALDTNTANRALSVLTSPPTTDKYKTIKTFFTTAYGLTDCERATALLNLKGLGDSKPSELMDNMLSLLGQHQPCFIFKQIFIQQLPEHVRTPLSVSDVSDYRTLAREADKLYLAGNTCNTNCQYQVSRITDPEPQIDAICCRVAKTELAPIERDSNKFRKVLQEFPALLQPTFTSTAVKHGVEHHICTTGPPVHSRARRLAPDRLAAARKEFIEMERMGIIRKSNSLTTSHRSEIQRWMAPMWRLPAAQ
ncbi:retrovirus-related pol polyprotein [Plakobranchus ocellatus]|uniref:Retrovirus-related pol polyprotein n=1 Tax=Plakobranchus ocellatus TaxID=259542 RepID=A0AAV4CA71_9GAST|nr:retrovirus-related pol polyprotein [Plakobranchus ocellatus]